MLASGRGAGLPAQMRGCHAFPSRAPPPSKFPWSGPSEEELRDLQTVVDGLQAARTAAAAPQRAAAVAEEEAARGDRAAAAAAEVAAAHRDSDRGRGAGRNEDKDWRGGPGCRPDMPHFREEAWGRTHNPKGQMGPGSQQERRAVTRSESAVVPVPPGGPGRESTTRNLKRPRPQHRSAGLLDSGSEQQEAPITLSATSRHRPPQADLAADTPGWGGRSHPRNWRGWSLS